MSKGLLSLLVQIRANCDGEGEEEEEEVNFKDVELASQLKMGTPISPLNTVIFGGQIYIIYILHPISDKYNKQMVSIRSILHLSQLNAPGPRPRLT